MQEVFEKIIEKLEEEREYSYANFDEYVKECSPCLDAKYDDCFHRGLERAARMIQEIVKEYNDGWIPVEERLPEERQPVYIRLDNGNVFRAEIRTRELLKEWWYCYGETDDMDMLGTIYEVKGWMKSNSVVAWQPLPKPYEPKGE